MKDTPTRILLIGAAGAVLALGGCQRQEPAAETAPAQTQAAQTPAPVPEQATAPGAEQATAVAPLGNCYDTANCTPAGNPPPGWGIMTQAACKAQSGAKSWREVNRSAQEIGPCIAPP